MAPGRGSRPLAASYAALGVARDIAVVVPTFAAAAAVVAGSDLVASLPDSLLGVLAPRLALRRVATPLAPVGDDHQLAVARADAPGSGAARLSRAARAGGGQPASAAAADDDDRQSTPIACSSRDTPARMSVDEDPSEAARLLVAGARCWPRCASAPVFLAGDAATLASRRRSDASARGSRCPRRPRNLEAGSAWFASRACARTSAGARRSSCCTGGARRATIWCRSRRR